MQVTFTDVVSKRSAGQCLHSYIALSYRFVAVDWILHIQQGGVTVDGKPGDPYQLIEAGQCLSISLADYQEKPVSTDWQLLWQSDDIIAVHKPSGLPVHRTPMHIYNTLIEVVKRESAWPDAHLLHRLDTDTGGIILLGKNKAAAMCWQPKIQQLMTRKIYRAVVYNKPQWLEYDMHCDLNTREDSVIKAQMYVCEAHEAGKHSHTAFRYVSGNNMFSLIECEIFTGRKHQIRVQLAHLGHAIVGDKIYANNGEYYLKRLQKTLTAEDNTKLLTSHHLLFAHKVSLSLPDRLVPVEIVDECYSSQWLEFCRQQGLTV